MNDLVKSEEYVNISDISEELKNKTSDEKGRDA